MSREPAVRRIAVVTGTRAEFGLLEPVLRAIRARPGLHADLIVTGMHLLRKFGYTLGHIRRRGWPVAARVPMQRSGDGPEDQAAALARGIAGIARALQRLDSRMVVVLGDRIEAFAGAVAAVGTRRVLVHIHGGDRATGDIDDSLRNAISRLAHVHLVASDDAACRLRRMGEAPGRIHVVGAPGLDDILSWRRQQARRPARLAARLAVLLGPAADRPYALVVQHPCGRSASQEEAVMRAIVRAVSRAGLAGVAIYPNSDPGHDGIIAALEGARQSQDWRVFRSLPRDDYLLVASRAALMVGNSSSGIIESASLGVPAVNIGDRQQGRLPCGPGVLTAGESTTAILRAMRRALAGGRPRGGRSVYGDGRAGLRIARILERLIISPALLRKVLTY